MLDNSKRNTLKTLSIASAGAAAFSMGSFAFTQAAIAAPHSSKITLRLEQAPAAHELRVVIHNPSDSQRVINQMSPGHISTELGDANLADLLQEGPVLLGPKQEISMTVQKSSPPRLAQDQANMVAKRQVLVSASADSQPKLRWRVA